MGFDIGGIALTSPGTTLALSNWMNINANGILTRPQTPYMRGQLTGKVTPYNASATGGVLLVTADANVGNCWNDATGHFTCPVAGRYMTTLGNIACSQAGYIYVQKNGGDYAMSHWNHMAAWHYISLSCIVECAANDTIRWQMRGLTPALSGFYASGSHCMYSIALLA